MCAPLVFESRVLINLSGRSTNAFHNPSPSSSPLAKGRGEQESHSHRIRRYWLSASPLAERRGEGEESTFQLPRRQSNASAWGLATLLHLRPISSRKIFRADKFHRR